MVSPSAAQALLKRHPKKRVGTVIHSSYAQGCAQTLPAPDQVGIWLGRCELQSGGRPDGVCAMSVPKRFKESQFSAKSNSFN